jgi:hypothetical protein
MPSVVIVEPRLPTISVPIPFGFRADIDVASKSGGAALMLLLGASS